MVERKPIHVEPTSDAARLLRLAGDEPITVETGGIRYRIEREAHRPTLENYDPAKALAALRRGIGALEGFDIEAFKEEIREQRVQNSKGRPA